MQHLLTFFSIILRAFTGQPTLDRRSTEQIYAPPMAEVIPPPVLPVAECRAEPYEQCLDIALDYVGVREFPGDKHNPVVLRWLQGVVASVRDDETAWCSAFANAVCEYLGLSRSGTLVARDWMLIGTEVDEPQRGDVVVFWRGTPDGWQGHVAFFIRREGDLIHCLGGNQSNRVSIAAYPAHRWLGYRRLHPVSDSLAA